jgi:hypothetical protein
MAVTDWLPMLLLGAFLVVAVWTVGRGGGA